MRKTEPTPRAGQRGPASCCRLPVPGEPAGKRFYRLVAELAGAGIPVTRLRAEFWNYLASPTTGGTLTPPRRVRSWRRIARMRCLTLTVTTPGFGHRLLADEARDAGEAMVDRTAWPITSTNGWWSAFGNKRGNNGQKPGPAVHDDHCTVTDEDGRVRHEFAAGRPNQLWLAYITEHKRSESKLYVCVIKGGVEQQDRRLKDEVRSGGAGARERCLTARRRRRLHCPQRPRWSMSKPEVPACSGTSPPPRIHGESGVVQGQRSHGVVVLPVTEQRPRPPLLDHARAAAHRKL